MAESFLYFMEHAQDVVSRYKELYTQILGKELKIHETEDDEYICNNMQFYDLSDKWSVGVNLEGNSYSEERLLQIACKTKMIYIYFEDDVLSGEYVVVRDGKIIRTLYDYFDTPELNRNEGKYEIEDVFTVENAADIAALSDYLFDNL